MFGTGFSIVPAQLFLCLQRCLPRDCGFADVALMEWDSSPSTHCSQVLVQAALACNKSEARIQS